MTYHKFHARPTETDGIKFASKKEAQYYSSLKLRVLAGDVVFFLRQVPFDLPGNIKYRCDFAEFLSDGSVHFVEVKGFNTPMGKLKIQQAEAIYPIKIKIV